jgi:hypothetical protein
MRMAPLRLGVAWPPDDVPPPLSPPHAAAVIASAAIITPRDRRLDVDTRVVGTVTALTSASCLMLLTVRVEGERIGGRG